LSKNRSRITHTGSKYNKRLEPAKRAAGPLERLALRSWAGLQVLVVLGFLGFLLFAMTPVWYAQITDHLKVLLSEVAIEPGKEQEWKLLPASGKGQPEARKTERLLPPSQFNHRKRQLILVAPSARGGLLKLAGQCKPSPVSGPWDLDCNGDWANVRDPDETVMAVFDAKAGIREHGRFTVAFFKGGREGNVTLMTADSKGAQSDDVVQRFFLVRGK
jgi:hypothetical protein